MEPICNLGGVPVLHLPSRNPILLMVSERPMEAGSTCSLSRRVAYIADVDHASQKSASGEHNLRCFDRFPTF